MRLLTSLCVGLVVAGWSVSAAAEVVVSFDHPETYTDAGLYAEFGAKAREPTMQGIREHLAKLGQRYLRPSQKLTVAVLDVDLAGRFEPWRPLATHVRFMRDITWPRIKLRYTLEENGVVRASGEEVLADQNYQAHAGPYFTSDPLRYEKAMLDDWFQSRFGKGH
ncbi:MAG TPA: DUF3016 domain-containing protein [Vineibacter sp.]|nr:DUF3016 domain-containing protein [Vineibacter sp.]